MATDRQIGDRARCQRCGGRIVLVKHPRIIALDVGLWVHEGTVRWFLSNHPAEGPTT